MAIEKAVSALSSRDFQRFHAWFEEFFAQKWDKQIEADAKSGKLDAANRRGSRSGLEYIAMKVWFWIGSHADYDKLIG
jgi:hypothetical protein